jgi:inosose dehydratase
VNARVASAPVSYGVFEITIGRPNLPAGAELAGVIAEAGYAGTELGPPGYFGDGAEVAALLAAHDLALVGSFLPLRLSRREAIGDDLRMLDETLATLEIAAGDGPLPRILLSDAFSEPERIAYAGRIESHRDAWLPAARQAELAKNAQLAAERCRARGFEVSFHYHAGTYVETPREIDAFVARIDPALLGLCFDTGHSAFGGGDPLALLAEFGELVDHVHLKDVDLERLAALHRSGGDLMAAWESGVFCELGSGGARVADCLAELDRRGYDGWIVVEQDRILRPDEPFGRAVTAAARNREWLREHGL